MEVSRASSKCVASTALGRQTGPTLFAPALLDECISEHTLPHGGLWLLLAVAQPWGSHRL